jgi:hypothetical protein
LENFKVTDHLRDRDRQKDDIKMDLKIIWYESLDWIQLAHDRNQRWILVKLVMKMVGLYTLRAFYKQSENAEYTANCQHEIQRTRVNGIYFVMSRIFILSL